MLFYFLFLCFVRERRNCFEGVSSQKESLLYVYTGYLFVFCVVISRDLFYSSDASAFINFIWGFALRLYIFFSIFIDYFKIFSIN